MRDIRAPGSSRASRRFKLELLEVVGRRKLVSELSLEWTDGFCLVEIELRQACYCTLPPPPSPPQSVRRGASGSAERSKCLPATLSHHPRPTASFNFFSGFRNQKAISHPSSPERVDLSPEGTDLGLEQEEVGRQKLQSL